jgi:limonene-1,2-epoxide hydrolase
LVFLINQQIGPEEQNSLLVVRGPHLEAMHGKKILAEARASWAVLTGRFDVVVVMDGWPMVTRWMEVSPHL